MEYGIIYKIIRTRNNIYITPKTFSLCEILENNKVKILSNDFNNQIIRNISEKFEINEHDEFAVVTLPQEYVFSIYNTYDVNEIKESIESTQQVLKLVRGELVEVTPSNFILDVIKSNIYGQDKQVKELFGAIEYNQSLYESPLEDDIFRKTKKNIIVSGPTGVGKTETIRQIAKYMNLPVIFIDMANYTYNGMTEEDVYKIIIRILNECGFDKTLAERAIIVFDNFDKLEGINITSAPELFSDYIIKTLNLFNDSNALNIKIEGSEETITFSKDYLTLILSGNFEKLLKTTGVKNAGYNINNEENLSFREKYKDSSYLQAILDCITNIIEFNELTEEDFRNILLESKISPLYIKNMVYNQFGTQVEYDEKYIEKVIKEAMKRKQGAKGLNQIVNETFNEQDYNVMFHNVPKLIVKEDKVIKKVKVRKIKKNIEN